jgi:hypothetical protein
MNAHHIKFGLLLAVGISASSVMPAFALDVMSDESLSSTTGQEGIGLLMEMRVNADDQGKPLTNPSLAANNGDFANCGKLNDFSSPGCRLAISFEGRNSGGNPIWLVFKNYYGRQYFPAIYLDSGTTPASASPYADLNRFKDKNGVPLLATPNNIPYLKFSAPKDLEIWNMTVGGLAIEYGATGYLNANSKSVGGIKISNSAGVIDINGNSNLPATVSIKGSVGLFGF